MPPYPLTNFEIQKYYDNESRFNGVSSRDNLPQKNVDTGTHWIALFCKKMKSFILIASVLSIFLKKFKNLLEIRT